MGELSSYAMNILQPWNIFFFVGLIVYVGIRNAFAVRTKSLKKTVSHVDGLERMLILMVALAFLLLPLLYLFTPLLYFADYRLPTFVLWIGAVLLVVSLWVFWRSHADLGENWSISLELRESHELVTCGVYRTIRHPMYTSIWLWGFAQAMLLQNWLVGWFALLTFAAMYFLRMPREEQMMREAFGETYRDYMKRTGRLWPRINSREPLDPPE